MYRAVNTFEWCVLHIFLSGISWKECLCFSFFFFCIFNIFFTAAVETWLKPSLGKALNFVEGIYLLHTITHAHTRPHTHTSLTPNHSRMAFTSTPCRALPLVEWAVWKHLNWHYVPLTCSTVTCCSSWKRLTWPQNLGVTMTKRRVFTRHSLDWLFTSKFRLYQVQKVTLCWDNQMDSTIRPSAALIPFPTQCTRTNAWSNECLRIYLNERTLKC